MRETRLAGGATNDGVFRVGDTVRRPGSPLMREVLRHLEQAGFDAAPRWLGVDDRGRDVLTWIDGETFTDRSRMHPYIGDPPVRGWHRQLERLEVEREWLTRNRDALEHPPDLATQCYKVGEAAR